MKDKNYRPSSVSLSAQNYFVWGGHIHNSIVNSKYYSSQSFTEKGVESDEPYSQYFNPIEAGELSNWGVEFLFVNPIC